MCLWVCTFMFYRFVSCQGEIKIHLYLTLVIKLQHMYLQQRASKLCIKIQIYNNIKILKGSKQFKNDSLGRTSEFHKWSLLTYSCKRWNYEVKLHVLCVEREVQTGSLRSLRGNVFSDV